jgi:hypothetical protein
VSITQLAFDRRLPVAREIAAYQKHRIKRIRRNNMTATPASHHRTSAQAAHQTVDSRTS